MDAVKSSSLDESAKRRHVHRGEKRKKSKSKKKKSKFMKTDSSETSTDSDESSDSSVSSLDKHKKKYKAFKRVSKHKRKKSDSDSSSCFQRKHQKCKKQHKKKSKHKKNKFHLTDIVKAMHKQPVECKELSENEIGPLPQDTGKSMAPMTKEEWEKQQSVIRRVYDPETGRNRLVKGDGEILEEIVSKERHKEINKAATFNDGEYYRKKMGL